MNPRTNPNAVIGFASGGAGGSIILYLLGLLGVSQPDPVVALEAGALSGLVLFVGRHGLRGLLRRIWRGP